MEPFVAELLEELRAAGYSPRAWARFLRRSLERARETKRARPRLARQARAWGTAGLTASLLASPRSHRRSAVVWWLVVWRMLDWHLGMAETLEHRRPRPLSPADALSLVRFWLVPPVLAASGTPRRFALLTLAAGATDVGDGLLARRSGPTRLGRDLDTTADVSFYSAAAWSAVRARWLAPWAGVALTFRLLLAIAYGSWSYFLRVSRPAVAPPAATRALAPLLPLGLALAALRSPGAGSALVGGASLAAILFNAGAAVRGAGAQRPAARTSERAPSPAARPAAGGG